MGTGAYDAGAHFFELLMRRARALFTAAAIVLAGCANSDAIRNPPGQTSASPPVMPPPQPTACGQTAPASGTLGDPHLLHDVCHVAADGVRQRRSMTDLLGGEESSLARSFRFTAAEVSMKTRDILSFQDWVKPGHFTPIAWSVDKTPVPVKSSLHGFFTIDADKPAPLTLPDGRVESACVPVTFTLPPQPVPGGVVEGATTRLWRCASDMSYRL